MDRVLEAVVFTSTAAMARVVVVCFAGFLLERGGVLRSRERKTIAQLVTMCLVPCLLFSSMSFAVQENRNFHEWAFLPLWAVLHVGFGVGISKAFIHLRRRMARRGVFYEIDGGGGGGDDDDQEANGGDAADGEGTAIIMSPLGREGGGGGGGSEMSLSSHTATTTTAGGGGGDFLTMDEALIIVCVAFPNSGNLPMALGQSVCSVSYETVFGDEDADSCSSLVVGYVALYLIAYQPLLWSLAPRFLAAAAASPEPKKHKAGLGYAAGGEEEDEEDEEEEEEEAEEAEAAEAAQGGEADQGGEPAVERGSSSDGPAAAEPSPRDEASPSRHRFDSAVRMKALVCSVPPPIYACLLGIIAGLSPPSLLFSDRSWLKPAFTDALAMLGDAAIPMQIINLGSSITAKRRGRGSSRSDLSMRFSSVVFVLTARLVAVPLLSIGTTQLLLFAGALPADNPHMLLVLMIESATPTAMQIMVMCQLWHQRAEAMLGGLFVKAYALSLVTLTLWVGAVLFLLAPP